MVLQELGKMLCWRGVQGTNWQNKKKVDW